MSLADVYREHLRIAVLRLLEQAPGHSANGSIIQEAVNRVGIKAGRDQIRTELAWLQEQGLISVEEVAPKLHVAELTQAGLDVATGQRTVPGIKRPAPGD